jgi:hypothetical protein
MKLSLRFTKAVSTVCWSILEPSVTMLMAWVSPRVKMALPWVPGSTSTSLQMGRI